MGMSIPPCCAACQTVVPRATVMARPSMVSVTVAGGSATARPLPPHPAPPPPLQAGGGRAGRFAGDLVSETHHLDAARPEGNQQEVVAFRPQGEEWTEILIPPPAALGGRHTRGLFRRHRLRSCGDGRGQSVLYVASPRARVVLVLGPEVLQPRVDAGRDAFPE